MSNTPDAEGRANRPGEPSWPVRQPLGHGIPLWVKDGAYFFITLCTRERAGQPLLQGDLPARLIESVRHLHLVGRWYARLFLIMPDHVHGLVTFPPDIGLAAQVAAWKGYAAKKLGVVWQERFFDHRIRNNDSLDEKAYYIRMNPVRAGLVERPEQWPYVFDDMAADARFGSAGTPRPTI